MSEISGDNLTRKATSLMDAYGPFQSPGEFETRKLEAFTAITEGMVIYGSGSLRSGRFLDRFSSITDVAQLASESFAGLASALEAYKVWKKDGGESGSTLTNAQYLIVKEYEPVIAQILSYKEPIRQWSLDRQTGQVTDGGISIVKARLSGAAALILHMLSGGEMPDEFFVIGRDYNLANYEFEFVDRPGYSSGWTFKNGQWLQLQEPQPVHPYDQTLLLYLPVDYYRKEALSTARTAIAHGDHVTAASLLRSIATEESGRLLGQLREASETGELADLVDDEYAKGPYDHREAKSLAAIVSKYQGSKWDTLKPFYFANSASVLHCKTGGKKPTREELATLINPSTLLPEWIDIKTSYSFMAALPNRESILGHDVSAKQLLQTYSERFLGAGGEYINKIPGVVDWDRPPFRQHLSLWCPTDESVIATDLAALSNEIAAGVGTWENFAQLADRQPETSDLVVGFPTVPLNGLLKEFGRL